MREMAPSLMLPPLVGASSVGAGERWRAFEYSAHAPEVCRRPEEHTIYSLSECAAAADTWRDRCMCDR